MITALTDPNQLPNQLQDQQTFDANMAYVIDMLPERARQENELAAGMSAIAAGGAYAFPYVFDSSIVDGDPGVGKLRLGSTAQNAASVLRMDVQIVGGTDITNVLADLRACTSAVKGSIRLVKMSDPSRWIIFDVTAVALPSGYRNLTVSARASGGGLASPFENGDSLMVYIDRNGDKGEVPLGGALVCLAAAAVSNVASINYLNLFTSEYDRYLIDFTEFQPTVLNAILQMRLAVGNVAYAGANYSSSPNPNSGPSGGTASAWALCGQLSHVAASPGVLVDIANTNSANSPVRAKLDSLTTLAAATDAQNPQVLAGFLTAKTNSVITGFQIYTSTGNISAGKLRVYGFRNQTGVI